MRAIRVTEFGQPEVLKIDNAVPVPQPSSKQVLIQVKSAGVNPIETYRRTGDPKRTDLPSLPWTPGSDAAGIVVKVGSDVTSVKFKYHAWNRHSLYFDSKALKEKRRPSYKVYTTLHPTEKILCTAPLWAKAKSGEKVLIHGASGAVGVGCIQFAKANGMQVYGTAGSDAGCTLVKQLGADYVFNHNERGYTTELMVTVFLLAQLEFLVMAVAVSLL
ncbi:quinone oxidoreductase-like [Glandiceps talaboti]